jgi:hypothetical protein
LIEVNGRMGGLQSELADRASGLDVIRLAADIAVGRPVSVKVTRPNRIYFQVYSPGPTASGVLLGSTGAAAVRQLPGVSRHRVVARPGAEVGGTASNFLDITFGVVDDRESLTELANAITGQLVHEFRIDGQVVTRTAAHLWSHE